jgi:hypothetical protein
VFETPEPRVLADSSESLTDYMAGLTEAIGIDRQEPLRPPFIPGPRRSPTGAMSCSTIARRPFIPGALGHSTEWEVASRTRPLPGRVAKAENVLVTQGGWRRKTQEIA